MIVEQDSGLSEGFVLDEDRALRELLKGLEVWDDQMHHRPVGVWFAHPDTEVRDQAYPYMTITLIDIVEATDKAQSWGRGEPYQIPVSLLPDIYFENYAEEYGNAPGTPDEHWESDPPIPVYIDYQVRAFSRHPRHDRGIIASILAERIPYHWASIKVNNEIRYMKLLDVTHQELVEKNKRLFVTNFTVRIDGWMPPSRIRLVIQPRVTDIDLDVRVISPVFKPNVFVDLYQYLLSSTVRSTTA